MADPTERSGLINQRYEVLGVIGRGGQGVVYRARDLWMQREVAIKVLGSKAAREPHTAERLIREQQALSALKGTAAVEVLDVCRGSRGELCLVMELLHGSDLDDHLYTIEQRGERIALARVVEIFTPIVDTLEVAHRAGILHRDLKPANVFLLNGGGVRLLDFGMARLKKAAPLTAAGTVMGSPSFMAPEAWGGRSELVDHRADVYSLGVILFRVLAGDLPFSGESLQDKFLGSTRGERPSLFAKRPDLPRDADEWVVLALAIDREARFRNVRALWNAFLDTFGLQAAQGKRPSFWAAAREAVQKLASGGSNRRPEPEAELAPAERRSEPSFGREALARSVMHVPQPEDTLETPPPGSTLELGEEELRPEPPPLVRRAQPESAAPPAHAPEKTLELSDSELVPHEETIRERR